MLYVVVEYYKMSRLCEAAVFDSRSGAEEYIDACFSDEAMGLYDYKTSFTIEEMEDECAHW